MDIIAGSFIYDSLSDYEAYTQRLVRNHIKNIRINCSNFEPEIIIKHVKMLRNTFSKIKYEINVFLDVPFPGEKVRARCNSDFFKFSKDQVYTLSIKDSNNESDLFIEDSSLFSSLSVNDTVYIDDGKYTFIVTRMDNDIVYMRASTDGKVLNNKAIYTENYKFKKKLLSNKDEMRKMTELLSNTDPEYLILSFCENTGEIEAVKNLIKDIGLNTAVIPKIESIEGANNYKELFPYVDILMLGRGDLGSTLKGMFSLGNIQSDFISECHKEKKKVLIATDILTSLKDNYFPSRAEIIDVYYLLREKVEYIFASAQIANKDIAIDSFCKLCRKISY